LFSKSTIFGVSDFIGNSDRFMYFWIIHFLNHLLKIWVETTILVIIYIWFITDLCVNGIIVQLNSADWNKKYMSLSHDCIGFEAWLSFHWTLIKIIQLFFLCQGNQIFEFFWRKSIFVNHTTALSDFFLSLIFVTFLFQK